MRREEHCKHTSLACVGSARSVSATLGLPVLTACVRSQSTLLRLRVALQGNCLRRALSYMHLPGLSRSGSGSQVLHRGVDLVGPAGPSSSGNQVLGDHGRPRLAGRGGRDCDLPRPWSLPLGFLGEQPARLLMCVSSGELISGCNPPVDVDCPEPQEVLVSNEAYLQFGIGCLSGAAIALFRLWLPSPACIQRGMGWFAAS